MEFYAEPSRNCAAEPLEVLGESGLSTGAETPTPGAPNRRRARRAPGQQERLAPRPARNATFPGVSRLPWFRFSGTATHPDLCLRFEALVLQGRLQNISTTGVDSRGQEGTPGDSINGEKQLEIEFLRRKSCAINQLVDCG